MNEARPYASLSSGLLARKGTAKPAMRPQGYGNLEDLGWNDMGFDPGQPGAAPPGPEHVPSSIAALTPAPKIQRTHPTDSHLPPDAEPCDGLDEGDELEEGGAADEPFAPEAFEPVEETIEFEPAAEPLPDFAEPAEIEPATSFEAEAEFAGEPEDVEDFEAPPVIAQQRAILERFDGEEEPEAHPSPAASAHHARAEIVPLAPRSESGGNRKAAFTLRLDAERHLRLRLACAVTRLSAQQIVARALDEALANIPEIESLASQVPAKSGRASKR